MVVFGHEMKSVNNNKNYFWPCLQILFCWGLHNKLSLMTGTHVISPLSFEGCPLARLPFHRFKMRMIKSYYISSCLLITLLQRQTVYLNWNRDCADVKLTPLSIPHWYIFNINSNSVTEWTSNVQEAKSILWKLHLVKIGFNETVSSPQTPFKSIKL